MNRVFAGLAVAGVVVLVGGTWLYVSITRQGDTFAACREGQVAGGDIGGPFTLVDTNGAAVTEKDVLTKPTLVYFGYSFCPDVCPLDLARNAEAVDVLEERGFDAQPVFISIDPARDTPEVLAEFSRNLHPRMIALTGTDAQVKAASQAYKTYYQKQDSGDEYYLMDHSTFTYLMLPGAGFADFFRRDDTAEAVADRVACFVTAAETRPQN